MFRSKTLTAINMTEEQLVKSLIMDVQDVFVTMVGIDDLLHLPIQIDVTTHFKNSLTALVGLAGTYTGLERKPIVMISASEMVDDIADLVNGLMRKPTSSKLMNELLQEIFEGNIDPI
jgi:hypothetical protein